MGVYLVPTAQFSLSFRVHKIFWGPQKIGKQVLIYSNTNSLQCKFFLKGSCKVKLDTSLPFTCHKGPFTMELLNQILFSCILLFHCPPQKISVSVDRKWEALNKPKAGYSFLAFARLNFYASCYNQKIKVRHAIWRQRGRCKSQALDENVDFRPKAKMEDKRHLGRLQFNCNSKKLYLELNYFGIWQITELGQSHLIC